MWYLIHTGVPGSCKMLGRGRLGGGGSCVLLHMVQISYRKAIIVGVWYCFWPAVSGLLPWPGNLLLVDTKAIPCDTRCSVFVRVRHVVTHAVRSSQVM